MKLFTIILLIFCFSIGVAQTTNKSGLTLLTNYSHFMFLQKHIQTEVFDVSDYESFGPGIENLEGRMRLMPQNFKYLQILNFSMMSYFIERNRFIFKITISLLDLSCGYNLYENPKVYLTASLGYNYTIYSHSLGRLKYLDSYQYPIYNYRDYHKIYLQSFFNILYTEFKYNFKINWKDSKDKGVIFYLGIRPCYVIQKKVIEKNKELTLVYPNTYNKFADKTTEKYFSIMYSIGLHFAKWE